MRDCGVEIVAILTTSTTWFRRKFLSTAKMHREREIGIGEFIKIMKRDEWRRARKVREIRLRLRTKTKRRWTNFELCGYQIIALLIKHGILSMYSLIFFEAWSFGIRRNVKIFYPLAIWLILSSSDQVISWTILE